MLNHQKHYKRKEYLLSTKDLLQMSLLSPGIQNQAEMVKEVLVDQLESWLANLIIPNKLEIDINSNLRKVRLNPKV